MQKIKLENVSFNKLKEFTSLGSKKNTTIKGKFTLIGEYQLITKDGGDSMTLSQLTKFTFDFVKEQREFNKQVLNMFKQIMTRLDNIELEIKCLRQDLDKVIKINNLKSYK